MTENNFCFTPSWIILPFLCIDQTISSDNFMYDLNIDGANCLLPVSVTFIDSLFTG